MRADGVYPGVRIRAVVLEGAGMVDAVVRGTGDLEMESLGVDGRGVGRAEASRWDGGQILLKLQWWHGVDMIKGMGDVEGACEWTFGKVKVQLC